VAPATSPVRTSHRPTEAFIDPHTGPSATPAPGAKMRISNVVSDTIGHAPMAPTIASGMAARSVQHLPRDARAQDGPAGAVVDPLVEHHPGGIDAKRGLGPGNPAQERRYASSAAR
jgi:hypothetical protein